jgi:hypothetical protein
MLKRAPMKDRNSSSTRMILSSAVVEYCLCCNRFFFGDYNILLLMLLMIVMMAAMEAEDGGCDENAADVCEMFVGRDTDDDIHCKAGKKGNRKYHGRLISCWRAAPTHLSLPATHKCMVVLLYGHRSGCAVRMGVAGLDPQSPRHFAMATFSTSLTNLMVFLIQSRDRSYYARSRTLAPPQL